jgi:Phage related hypothetical protein (DUF1799)
MTDQQALDWLNEEDEEGELEVQFAVYPCNLDALRVFITMNTQWRVCAGMAGLYYIGLDYNVLPEVWKRTGIAQRDRDDVFEKLRIMEAAALTVLNASKKAET